MGESHTRCSVVGLTLQPLSAGLPYDAVHGVVGHCLNPPPVQECVFSLVHRELVNLPCRPCRWHLRKPLGTAPALTPQGQARPPNSATGTSVRQYLRGFLPRPPQRCCIQPAAPAAPPQTVGAPLARDCWCLASRTQSLCLPRWACTAAACLWQQGKQWQQHGGCRASQQAASSGQADSLPPQSELSGGAAAACSWQQVT